MASESLLIEKPVPPAAVPAWLEIPLTDVRIGETFRLADFRGKTVIFESMAVWCPCCIEQQFQLAGA